MTNEKRNMYSITAATETLAKKYSMTLPLQDSCEYHDDVIAHVNGALQGWGIQCMRINNVVALYDDSDTAYSIIVTNVSGGVLVIGCMWTGGVPEVMYHKDFIFIAE